MYELTMDFGLVPVTTNVDLNVLLSYVANIAGGVLSLSQRRALFGSLGVRLKGHRYQINSVPNNERLAA